MTIVKLAFVRDYRKKVVLVDRSRSVLTFGVWFHVQSTGEAHGRLDFGRGGIHTVSEALTMSRYRIS